MDRFKNIIVNTFETIQIFRYLSLKPNIGYQQFETQSLTNLKITLRNIFIVMFIKHEPTIRNIRCWG